ncbi:hypothetical protein [Pseudofrankia sp. DC12]|uniref:hypothetical protein n=1 Tax=Pseudofrankia sp. DC12 TaxID=683315 RepID=UPI000A6DB900|nr:hypothetical protein [Pseudofrankia sp. DC12]
MSLDSIPAQGLASLEINPDDLEFFLRTHGWRRIEYQPNRSAIWENTSLDASLMVPHNRSFRDFEMRLRDALEVVSLVHEISQGELPIQIARARNDIVFLRTDQTDADGSIPLGEARALLDGISRIMLVAACSAIRPRPSNPGKRPGAATDFVMNDLRLGHFMQDGFILPIFVRHEEQADSLASRFELDVVRSDPPAGDSPVAFSRHVVETLANGIAATRELLDPGGDISLDEAVERGVSAEMVESVGSMGRQEGVRSIDLSFLFSESIPFNRDIPAHVEVPRPRLEQVEKVVASLKKRPLVVANEIVGQVIRLERADGNDDGTVVVDGFLGKIRRRVKINLSGDAYKLAIHAHEMRQPVIASGEMSLVRRSWYLVGQTQIRFPA